jgi:thioredoxin 1
VEKVARSPMPAVVDFWAPWCDPCRDVDPILEKMAERYEGRVEFFRMNVDEEKDTPDQYAVRSIPTVLFFKKGALVNQVIGVEDEETFEKAILDLI